VRFEFLKIQKLLACLQERDRILDDLGDGYRVMDYENLKTELQTIALSIDIRNEDLEHYRARYANRMDRNKSLVRQKSQVAWQIFDSEELLASLSDDIRVWRDKCLKSFSEKERYRRELDRVQSKIHLINRVPLLRRYDNIVDDIDRTNNELVEVESLNKKLSEELRALQGDGVLQKAREMELTKLDTFLSQKKDELESFFNSRKIK
jgi:chromosome segregation ATPase